MNPYELKSARFLAEEVLRRAGAAGAYADL